MERGTTVSAALCGALVDDDPMPAPLNEPFGFAVVRIQDGDHCIRREVSVPGAITNAAGFGALQAYQALTNLA
jgi:hypothetical protein